MPDATKTDGASRSGSSQEQRDGAAGRRTRGKRRWQPIAVILTVVTLLAAIAYDLLPLITLEHRIDTFMDIARMGEDRGKVNAALAAEGFQVPGPDPVGWQPPATGRGENYLIRSRAPLLERVADRLSLLGGFDAWYADKKPPHQAYVFYDADNRIRSIEFTSRFEPLGLE